jgi:hypothetical protein
VQARILAHEVRQLVGHHGDAVRPQHVCDLSDALRVGSVALSDGKRFRVQPQAVAAFGSGVSLQLAQHWHSELRDRFAHRITLRPAQRLAQSHDDRARWRGQHGVVREDAVGVALDAVLFLVVVHLHAVLPQDRRERVVLAHGRLCAGRGEVVPLGGVLHRDPGPGPPHQGVPQGAHHAAHGVRYPTSHFF